MKMDNKNFELALSYTDSKSKKIYSYFCKLDEEDLNASTIILEGSKLLCNNYFAYSSLISILHDIYHRKIKKFIMSADFKKIYEYMICNGEFED